MDILIIGLGVIGTTYGYLFQKSGYNVEHYIRSTSSKNNINDLKIEILDGRTNKRGDDRKDIYHVKRMSKSKYDFIFVSVSSGGVDDVITWLNNQGIKGTIVLCCGIWQSPTFVQKMMHDRPYILGFPVAGGNIESSNRQLNTCVFDHFMIENPKKVTIPNYSDLEEIFKKINVKLKHPYDMLEWIWIHMAVNAAVGSVAGEHADMKNVKESAETLMNSSYQLKEVIQTIRETCSIVAKRGVNLKRYMNELLPYYLPTWISVPLMKKMFATNQLTRKIMTLHTDINDLMYVNCAVYKTGKQLGIECPAFDKAYENTYKKLI